MAHSRPSEIDNRGDATRATHAAGFFILVLTTDRRVQAYQRAWFMAWQNGKQKLDQVLAKAKATPGAKINMSVINAGMDQFTEGVRAGTRQFVREELRLKRDWIPWVADALIEAFHIHVYNQQHSPPKQFGIPVWLAPETPQGKLPRHEGQDIDRNVRWFYLTHVSDKPVSIHDLARDYQLSLTPARTTDCRSVVQNGIKQAEALLELVAKRAVRLPPGK